jgi:hypothetical protein
VGSLTALVDGHRVNLHRFDTETAAREFDAMGGAWCTWPIKARSHEGRTRRIGRVVVESDPEQRFIDPVQVVPVPSDVLEWAPIVRPGEPEISLQGDLGPGPEDPLPGFLGLVKALRLAGFEVIETALLPPGQLRVGCVDGIAATIEGDRFLVYWFATREAAEAYAATERHAVTVGPLVLRSTPEDMYVHQGYEILYAGDDRVRWSPLLEDLRFRRVLESVAGPEIER